MDRQPGSIRAIDQKGDMSKPHCLLRFVSRGLPVVTRAECINDELYVILSWADPEKGNIELGRRRLGKKSCCQSRSPCIGYVPVSPEHHEQFGLPAFVHISLCFEEIVGALNEMDPKNADD